MVEHALRAIAEADREAGKRKNALKADLINNVANFCDLLERWARQHGSGQGRSTLYEIARDLYGRDVIRSREDVERVQGSLRRWANWGRRAGLFELEEAFKETGASDGVIWRHLDPRLDSELVADVAQLARATLPPCELQRRRETAAERLARRSRPRARRTGRQGVPRLVPGPRRRGPLSFSPEKSERPSRPPRPFGAGGQENAAPAREAAGGLDRRARAFAIAHRLAALERHRTTAGEGELAALRQAARREPPSAVVLAAWFVLFGPDPRLSLRRFEQLERALAQAQRVRRSRTEGPEWLLGAMADHARRVRERRAEPPASIAYFTVPFRQIARKMRAEWRRRRRKGPRR
jgi:hypothetical protein